MIVNEKEMYHIHNNKVYNDLWIPGNEIIIEDNFDASYSRILKYFSTAINIDNQIVTLNEIIDYYLKKDTSKEFLIELLKNASHIILGMNIFKRELALEEIRRQRYSDLPSRRHSIWLCDKEGLEFWEKQISNRGKYDVNLYKVLVSGNLFKTSEYFIPNDYSDYYTNLMEAETYWNPKFENEEQEKRAEYLFQGKLKILEKINNK